MTRPSGGADYNLGRAHGEIEITADTRGAQEAQAAMAATAAEAEVLDNRMGRVNDTFAQNQRQTVLSSEAIVRHRQQVEDLQRTYSRYHEEYQRAVNRTKEAEDALNRARQAEDQEQNVLLRLARDVERTRDNEERLLNRVETAHARYQTRLQQVTSEVQRFNEAHIQASSGLNRMRIEAERVGESLENLSSKLSSVLRIVGQGGIMGLFAGGSGGTTAALGASGLSGLTNVMAGVMEMVQQLSGVLALFPAVVSGAAVSLGTLAVGFHGVGQALSSMGDTRKFLESIRQLAPAARDVVVQIYSFSDAMRGARQMIQQSLFAPIVADIQPLIQTWLPQLMRAGQAVGNEFGQMGHQFAQFMMQPATMQAFNSFIQNMSVGLHNAAQAMQPLLTAWRTLTDVGGTFFPRIGQAITTMANEFNNMVQGAASSGRLQAWINSALDGFVNLGHTILNTVDAIQNIFSIGDRYGGGFLAYLRQLSEEFRNWTISPEGTHTLQNFFQLIQSAGQAVHPILKLLAEGIATVAGALTRLGIGIAPGVTSFFQSILQALQGLAPVVQQLAPSINSFLVEFGRALQQVVATAGPNLPTLFQGLAQAFQVLIPLAVDVTNAIISIFSHLTPGEIQGIILTATAVRLLAGAFGILTAVMDANPVVLVAAAIAGLGIAVYEAYQHWTPFHNAIQTVWNALKEFANWLRTLPGMLSNALRPIDELASKAFNWGKNLVQGFINGISSMLRPVGDVASQVIDIIEGHWHSHSRTRFGPFSQASPEEMGAGVAQGYAAGIAGGAGAVGAASSGIAGTAAGIGAGGGAGGGIGTTGLSFSTAGASGQSGVGVTGNSGFDQYINFLTKDLTAWNNIFQQSFQLVTRMIDTTIQGINVVASIWGGGDNPLTRPGGIAGPPIAYGQQHVPGVPDVQIPGQAPNPALAPLGDPRPSQQAVPGVPNVNPRGRVYQPGTAGQGGILGPPPPAAPPPGPGSAGLAPAAPSATGGTVSGGDPALIAALQAKGFSPQLIRATLGMAQTEGLNPSGIPTLGFTDDQAGTTLQGHVDALANQLQNRVGQRTPAGKVIGPFPQNGSDRDQAEWFADVVGQQGSPSDWQGNAQPPREDYVNRVIAGMGGVQVQGGPQPAQGGLAANGQLFGQQRPGVQQGQEGLRPAAQNISSIIQTLFPQIQTIGGVRGDPLSYHPSGHALDIMLPGGPNAYNTPENIALGNQINQFLRDNAEALGISDTIFRGMYYATGQDPTRYQDADSPDPNARHDTHIHVTTQGPGGGGGDEPSNFQRNILALRDLPPSFRPPAAAPAIPPVPGLPPGPSIPIGGLGGAIGPAASIGAGLLGVEALRRLSSRARTAYLRATFDQYDAQSKLDIVRSLSPGEIAEAGLTSPDQITFGNITPGQTQGLFTDLGPAPQAGVPAATGGIIGRPPPLRLPFGEQARQFGLGLGGVDMTPEQLAALRRYTSSSILNRALRDQAAGRPLIPAFEAHAQNLDALLRGTAGLPQDLTVTRFLTNEAFGGVDPNNLSSIVGRTFNDPGFLSSHLGVPAQDLPPEISRNIQMELNVPAGTRGLYVPGQRAYVPGAGPGLPQQAYGENEFLLPRGGSYTPTSVYRNPLGGQIVRAQYIPPEGFGGPALINPPANVTGSRPAGVVGADPANVIGDAAGRGIGRTALGFAGRGLGGAADVLGLAASPLTVADRGPGYVAATTGTIAAGTTAGVAASGGLTAGGLLAVPSLLAGTLYATSAATGTPTGQEPSRTAGQIAARQQPVNFFPAQDAQGRPLQVGPARPAAPPAARPTSTIGDAGAASPAPAAPAGGALDWQTRQQILNFGTPEERQRLLNAAQPAPRIRATIGDTVGTAGSTPVHVTNPSDLPGGRNAEPPKAAPPATQSTGQPVQAAIRPTSIDRPISGTPPQNPPAQVQGQAPAPNGPGGYMDYRSVYAQAPDQPGAFGGQGQLPFNAQTPLAAFQQGAASVGNIASDAFQIFTDVIQNISATAAIADTMARGLEHSEDIVKIIQNFQTYLKTAGDIAHMVSDIGGVVAAAGAGDPTGGAGAAGGAVQAVGAIVQSVIEGVNNAITIGIEIYHEVGKYAGFIFGELLGGPATGPLGGNVRMLLNTNTNQLYTYSQDNPLNKNVFNVPNSQIAYNAPIQQSAIPSQVNIYAGPGQTPAGMMAESMWMVSTGAPAVASVAGRQ